LSLNGYSESLNDADVLSKLSPDERDSVFALQAKADSQFGNFTTAQSSAEKAIDSNLLREFVELEERRSAAELPINGGKFNESARISDRLLRRSPDSPPLLVVL
jgi:hypothetical protein